MSIAARSSRPLARVALLCACVLATACSGDGIDLVARFDQAELHVETRRLDIGTPLARPHLTGGWLDYDERWLGREEQTFVWSGRWGAEITFWVFEQRDLPSAAYGWSRLVEGVPTVGSFELMLNDVPVHGVEVASGAQEYRFNLPGQLLNVGRNRLLLRYEPGSRGWAGDDRRQFAWDWIEIGRTVVTDLPRRERPAGVHALLVPYLSELSYEIPSPSDATLRLAVDHFGPHWDDIDRGRLLIRIVDADEQVLEQTELVLDRRHELELSVPETEAVRITFITLPPGSGRTRAEKPMNEQIGGAMLIRPRLD